MAEVREDNVIGEEKSRTWRVTSIYQMCELREGEGWNNIIGPQKVDLVFLSLYFIIYKMKILTSSCLNFEDRMEQCFRKHLVDNAPVHKHKDFIAFGFVHGVG